jgi:ATP-dependent DNA helicase RecQ
LTVAECKRVAKYLKENGFNAQEYYARIENDLGVKDFKKTIEQNFIDDKYDVIVATIAYGMGVDKKNIAFVVHYQQPAGIIAYYQQIGRAGRDKNLVKSAYAIMLVGNEDNDTNIYFITHAFPTAADLTKAIDYVSDYPECSRQDIMDEFNWNQDKADKIIEYLLVDGYLYRKNSRYFRTEREWTCDMKRSKIVSWYRWKEFREFNKFIDSKECYMKQIRNALDDHTARNCGRCANCIGKHFFE